MILVLSLEGCRHDISVKSEEMSAYLADYEVPVHKWGFLNQKGELIIKPVYDEVGFFNEGMAAVNSKGLWGFIDTNGKEIISPAFKSVWSFHENRARIQLFDHGEQFIDRKGYILKTTGWSASDDFSGGLARVKVGDTYGYIDSTGLMIIQPIFTRGWNFNEGICVVEYHEKQGVIDSKGAYILKPEFDWIKVAGDAKIILCRQANNSMAYDINGGKIASLDDCKMVDSDGKMISVRKNNFMYLFSISTYLPVTTYPFSNINYLESSLWAGKTTEGYIVLDSIGKPLTSIAYHQINKYSNGFAAYSKGDFWGYINMQGQETTKDVFGLAWDYKEGYARAAFKDGIAFIDAFQKLAFYPPAGALELRDFSGGLAPVQVQ
ncbi:MAG: WG repeat-containing protein [Saprospiraceae bacterium]